MRFPGLSPAPGATPDAVRRSFVERLPEAIRPYARMARLDRPIGWWLLVLPCWWSAALAARMAGQVPDAGLFLLFLIGAVVMRGAGSTWNDISDRDLDASVARTASRPLPSGQVSVKQALLFLALQALIGLGVLLTFNRFAIVLGLLSLAPVLVYPFMKRVTHHPQVVLGLAFAWGALMGFAVQLGTVPLAGLLLYAGTIFWVVGYDTIYALQDIEDDAIVGIGSTARAYGRHVRLFIVAMYGAASTLIGAAISLAGAGPAAWLGLLAFATHLGWQALILRREDPLQALRLFRANRDAGFVLFAGLMLDALIAVM
ncbi:MAG: 4-hydroxybenzoate octaprenyltransferase [Proteobacteria bacterium]|nr:4-hydroxybenzoate octaprenyltransferase [Pseudomonadota bacterium]